MPENSHANRTQLPRATVTVIAGQRRRTSGQKSFSHSDQVFCLQSPEKLQQMSYWLKINIAQIAEEQNHKIMLDQVMQFNVEIIILMISSSV